jgi:TAT (twin-arginine translocation) pathway signal sequence
MNRRSLMKFTALAGAATLLSGCWLFPSDWKSKMTVTVSTPHGDVSGSAVRWHRLEEDPVLPQVHFTQKGEAVVVEVAPGRYLFALIEEHKPQDELIYFPGEAPLQSTAKLSGLTGKVIAVPTYQYPKLVTFGNINDPKSVKEVGLFDMAATFGAGYALKSITLEITDEKMTEGVVEKVLDWLPTIWPNQLDGNRFERVDAKNRFANSLNPGNFGDYSKGAHK